MKKDDPEDKDKKMYEKANLEHESEMNDGYFYEEVEISSSVNLCDWCGRVASSSSGGLTLCEGCSDQILGG